jgi:hypothetical protein
MPAASAAGGSFDHRPSGRVRQSVALDGRLSAEDGNAGLIAGLSLPMPAKRGQGRTIALCMECHDGQR